jgi:ferredoxin
LAAHFLRAQELGLAVVCLFAPLLLFIRKWWVSLVFQELSILGAAVWMSTTFSIIENRVRDGQSWTLTVIIMGTVIAFTLCSGALFRTQYMKKAYRSDQGGYVLGTAAFFLTAIFLTIIQIKTRTPMILLERYIQGGGWIEIFLLSAYAGMVADFMKTKSGQTKWRSRIWVFFSFVFFLQFAMGLLGVEKFLMTGALHLPVPALIAAGPVFRGERFFMIILFASTLVLCGPAWCSYLCYIGAWDNASAKRKTEPTEIPKWTKYFRVVLLFAVLGVALLLRVLGVEPFAAFVFAAVFGVIGVGLMMLWSTRTGTMTHCTVYCPMGVISNYLGKISPFRIRLTDGCTKCGSCQKVCRYNALTDDDIEKHRPGITCTLCGDCLDQCQSNNLEYRFPMLTPEDSRKLFIIIVVSLHAVFLGVARM